MAAAELHKAANGAPIDLEIHGTARERQQDWLERVNPAIKRALYEGLARGSSREASSDRWVEGVSIRFNEEIQDFGLVTELLQAVCWRLGVRLPNLRDRTEFSSRGAQLDLRIDVRGVDE